jgi:S-DNA-T family DNA segregation ATPase FtsK/SpoIIIE
MATKPKDISSKQSLELDDLSLETIDGEPLFETADSSRSKKTRRSKSKKEDSGLSDQTIQILYAIGFFVFGIFFSASAINKAGVFGEMVFSGVSKALGYGYYLLPILLIALGLAFLADFKRRFDMWRGIGSVLFFLSCLGLMQTIEEGAGGVLGTLVALPLLRSIDTYMTVIILVALIPVSLVITFDVEVITRVREWLLALSARLLSLFKRAPRDQEVKISSDYEEASVEEDEEPIPVPEEDEEVAPVLAPATLPDPVPDLKANSIVFKFSDKEYKAPPLSLLEKDKGKAGVGDIKANANIIKRTLGNFGIDVEMDEITIGPSVTRFALKPAEGVKLSKIVALGNDLSLALAAHPLRIEAPIPGKSLVGIEIPNHTKTTVGLGSVLATEEFKNSDKALYVALGKTISGKPLYSNIAKMPHSLVAGTTGSGKSVMIHAIINSLLYRNGPDALKFIMVDPKRVELTLYNNIPHLLTPVITEPKKAILALKWATKEMERRYEILQEHKVRDIDSYHKNVVHPRREGGLEVDPMPYIVVIMDEIADLMQTYPRELESGIVRLAQMSRAVGIHLILATQRPSVNVITGLIKANIPTRLALKVASQVDSRTIIDTVGAETLLGYGDMLYVSSDNSKPTRVQSPFISEVEVKKVVDYLISNYRDELSDEINLTGTTPAEKDPIFDSMNSSGGNDFGDDDDDDMYEDAKAAVLEAGKASTSYIQRKLRVGYSRAARLVDLLEKRGVIGPADGAKPRQVISDGAGAANEQN